VPRGTYESVAVGASSRCRPPATPRRSTSRPPTPNDGAPWAVTPTGGWRSQHRRERAFCAQLAELCRISGRRLEVAVRLDATVVPAAEAPLLAVPERERVVGTTGQLVELVRRWRLMPATHMVNVRSADPVGDLGRLAHG
jgi:hypothetical protein